MAPGNQTGYHPYHCNIRHRPDHAVAGLVAKETAHKGGIPPDPAPTGPDRNRSTPHPGIAVCQRCSARKNRDLEAAMKQIKTLSGLLPICMHCKKIRDDKGYWQQMETYIHKHSDAQFSHSICRECAEQYYPDLDIYDD